MPKQKSGAGGSIRNEDYERGPVVGTKARRADDFGDSIKLPLQAKAIGETDCIAEAAQRGLGRLDSPSSANSDSAFEAISSTVVFYSLAEK